jgi:hypothetical protein
VSSLGAEILDGSPQIQIGITVDLGTGSITYVDPNATGYGIERYPAGWFRVWLTVTNNGTGNVHALLSVYNSDFVNNATIGSVYAWGAQIEQGPDLTSYIPTTTAATLRLADLATASDVSWLATDRGTLRAIATVDVDRARLQPAVCLLAAPPDQLCLGRGASGSAELSITAGATQTVLGTQYSIGVQRTVIAAWAPGEVSLWDDAGVVGAATTAPQAIVQAALGRDATNVFEGHLLRVTYWPERLDDHELAAVGAP